MVNGNIETIRVPMTIDYLAAADTALQFGPPIVFPTTEFDVVESSVISVTGNGTRRKVVLIYVGRTIL